MKTRQTQPRGQRVLARFTWNTCALAALLLAATLEAAVYDVNLPSPQFTLYTDPYNVNEIKVGGFSGLYPVPGESDAFYVVTDRGPAPDFVDAGGTAFKTFAVPGFGPHLLTVRLQPNGTAKIDEVKPLKRGERPREPACCQ